jgi:hypothetical protein
LPSAAYSAGKGGVRSLTIVSGKAGHRIDPILGQAEIGLKANDRKRQVQVFGRKIPFPGLLFAT